MASATRICKTCGKEYPFCYSDNAGLYRWQDVACSPECGAKYFEAIAKSRSEKPAKVEPTPIAESHEEKEIPFQKKNK